MKQVKVQGLLQNCFRRSSTPAPTIVKKDDTIKKYESLERKNLPNGFTEQVEIKDYPINSKSVTSYADGADYRNDPAQAVENAKKRVNLGDITNAQQFLEDNPYETARAYRNILKQIENLANFNQGKKEPPTSTPTDGGEKQ